MSAIPQLPEHLHNRQQEPMHSMLVKEHLISKEPSVSYIEHVSSDSEQETNGVESKNSHSHTNGVTNEFKMHDTVIENFRPIKVIVIGAGYSGIYHGIRIPE